MRIVKKLALVVVASSFIAGGLAGCGDKKEPAKEPAKEAPKEAPK
jgi:uncharacterized lipoprotein YehR (DUF1307 family)